MLKYCIGILLAFFAAAVWAAYNPGDSAATTFRLLGLYDSVQASYFPPPPPPPAPSTAVIAQRKKPVNDNLERARREVENLKLRNQDLERRIKIAKDKGLGGDVAAMNRELKANIVRIQEWEATISVLTGKSK